MRAGGGGLRQKLKEQVEDFQKSICVHYFVKSARSMKQVILTGGVPRGHVRRGARPHTRDPAGYGHTP